MHFEIIGEITNIEPIAVGKGIRDIERLKKQYGRGNWHENIKYHFVVCVQNEDCEDLELRKIYQVLPDDMAEKDGYVRVIDESGEDYLYPSEYFLLIELPHVLEKALLATI